MIYSHQTTQYEYCVECERLEALARLNDSSFIPCRQCWERAVVVSEPEVDDLL